MKKYILGFLFSFLLVFSANAAPCSTAGSYNTSALSPSTGNEGKIPGFGPSDKPCTGNVAVYFTPTQVKSAANLSNVDNTSDANKPISTATQTALDAKQSNVLVQNKILVGNASNIATAVDLANDATIVSSGALTISNNAITTSKINDAAIIGAKLANNAVDLAGVKVTGILPNSRTTAEEYTGFPNSPYSIVRRDVDGLSTSNYADDASRTIQINFNPTPSTLRSYIPFFSNATGGTETPQINTSISVVPSTGSLWAGELTATNGNVIIVTSGKGLQIKSGTNARAGIATLVGGTITIANTSVTSNTKVTFNRLTPSGILGELSAPESSKINGTSFVIQSASVMETSTVFWQLIELIP